MNRRFKFSFVSLALVLLASACAPAATVTPTAEVALPVALTATIAAPVLPSEPEATATVQPVEVLAVATSRGPNLEATDPATVSLAAGQLQLVEFFRFT